MAVRGRCFLAFKPYAVVEVQVRISGGQNPESNEWAVNAAVPGTEGTYPKTNVV